MNYQEFFRGLKNKKIAVAGAGISNTPLIKLLVEYGADVLVCDKKKTVEQLKEQFPGQNIKFSAGEDYLKNLNCDIIFRSPGIRPDIDEFKDAVARGAHLTSEMEVFFDLCPCKIFAVTGSDGKTTTTTLISKFFENGGYKVHLGGNIGKPLLPEIASVSENDAVVLELSSFQLFTLKKSPHIAVVTNLSPNHLDWHRNMQEYIDAKKNIFLYQDKNCRLVTNLDNEPSVEISKEAKGSVMLFSRKKDADICLKDGYITVKGEKILDTGKILLPGVHNIENYMAAIGAVYGYVKKEDIEKTAESVKGIEHRIEFVREKDGVKYYNDSIASSPTRSIAGLRAFNKKVIMIAGGYDKHIPYDCIGDEIAKYVKVLVLTGQTAAKIRAAVENSSLYDEKNLKIIEESDFKKAVYAAKDNAENGDTVILSPASASFDMFKNFEERGKYFKEIVNSL